MQNKPFIVTGASASGKTTLVEWAMKNGYNHLPTHTTRLPRRGEIDGVHSLFLTESEFISNFKKGAYLEESLSFAKLQQTGIYYGTPKSWITSLIHNHCATPTSLKVAKKIQQMTGILWIHLYCDDDTRMQRLQRRGIGIQEIKARMNGGDSRLQIPLQAISFNTSKIMTQDIFNFILQQRGKNNVRS